MKNLTIKQMNTLSKVITGVACAGVIGTGVTAAFGATKATKILEEHKDEDLSKKDKFKLAAPCFIPAVAVGGSTIACILGNGRISARTQALLSSAYASVATQYSSYRHAVRQDQGKEKDEEYVKYALAHTPEWHDMQPDVPDEKMLWYEPYSNTYFEAYERDIIDAEYHLLRNYILRGYVSIEEYWYFLGIIKRSEKDIGWSVDSELYTLDWDHEIVFDEDKNCNVAVISPMFAPTEDYMDGWR